MSTNTEVSFPDRWFLIPEAAVYLRCSPQTVRNLIHKQEIRAARLTDGGGYRIDKKDLDHYLEKRKRVVAPYAKGTHPWVKKSKPWNKRNRKRVTK